MYYEKKIDARQRERKHLDFGLELKSLDQQGRFAGYASVFDYIDTQRDVIVRGAFSKTLNGRIHNIKLLWQHQQDEPIGIFDRIFEDERGLYVEGRLLLTVQRAKEAYVLLKESAISGLSIGYSPIRYHIDDESGVRYLSEVDLWEVSLVTFPANEAANVTVIKHFDPHTADCESQAWNDAQKIGSLIELSSALDRAIHTLKY